MLFRTVRKNQEILLKLEESQEKLKKVLLSMQMNPCPVDILHIAHTCIRQNKPLNVYLLTS